MGAQLFRGLRREIATVLNGQKRTLYQTAKAISRRSGDIQKIVRQMHQEGVLLANDPVPVQGTLFWLNPDYQEALVKALRAGGGVTGLVQENQDLILIRSPSRKALDGVLGRGDLAVVITWAARLGGGREMLLAISPEATETDLGRLEMVLEEAKIEVTVTHTARLLDGEDLRSNAKASLEATVTNPVEA